MVGYLTNGIAGVVMVAVGCYGWAGVFFAAGAICALLANGERRADRDWESVLKARRERK